MQLSSIDGTGKLYELMFSEFMGTYISFKEPL